MFKIYKYQFLIIFLLIVFNYIEFGNSTQSLEFDMEQSKAFNFSNNEKCYQNLLNGKIIGEIIELPNGKFMKAFRGIPYAKPPIGDLRFKLPVPLDKLPHPVLDCTKERDVCLQDDFITNEKIGSENCLYLNLYQPIVLDKNKKIPVMLFIHGGGFAQGSGDSSFYSPEFLVQHDVIVITFNYRLGAFGFLYLPDAEVYSNFGLYDQLEVLKWVKRHVHLFNGDPDNVTLFGQSAGSVSTHIHVISSMSRPYFHKAICQSGSLSNDWVLYENQDVRSRNLSNLLGFNSDNDYEILEFLKSKSADEIFEKTKLLLSEAEKLRGLPFEFRPVVEKRQGHGILTKYPSEYINGKEDNFNIPVIMGMTSKESICVMQIKENPLDIKESIPLRLNIDINGPEIDELVSEIKEFYFGDRPIDEDGIIALSSDQINTNGIRMDLGFLKKFQKQSKIYLYVFDFDGELNMFKRICHMERVHGPSHGDELFYLYTNPDVIQPDSSSPSYQLREKMTKMWTDYAKYSNPTPTSNKWKPINNYLSEDYHKFLRISDNIEMANDSGLERYKFWKGIYKKYNKNLIEPKFIE